MTNFSNQIITEITLSHARYAKISMLDPSHN